MLETWDIEQFPLRSESAFDHRKPIDPDWASRAPKPVLRSGDEGEVLEDSPEAHHHNGDGMTWSPETPARGGYYHMPGITHEEDEEEGLEPAHYHVVTGHADSDDPSEWTEHPYTMFEHPDSDYDVHAAHDYFQQDHPEYNQERNIHATHEVKHVHPAELHDQWEHAHSLGTGLGSTDD